MWLYHLNFDKNYLENLTYNVKRACIFHLTLVGILFRLIFSIKNSGVGFFYLTDKISLSLTNVICRWSLTTKPYESEKKAKNSWICSSIYPCLDEKWNSHFYQRVVPYTVIMPNAYTNPDFSHFRFHLMKLKLIT